MKKRFFDLARKIGIKGDDRRYYLGAVGIRRDGVTVVSNNIPNMHPEPQAHAEARLTKKLDRGSVVYVVRVSKKGDFTSSKPCKHCQRMMKARKVKRCYYSISGNKGKLTEYGVIIF